uniref:Uncharacterized protein n=1 Tax=Mus spicilegus TaxID=10103 RepID=A0A8C6MUW0_MUSSI
MKMCLLGDSLVPVIALIFKLLKTRSVDSMCIRCICCLGSFEDSGTIIISELIRSVEFNCFSNLKPRAQVWSAHLGIFQRAVSPLSLYPSLIAFLFPWGSEAPNSSGFIS